MTGSEAPRARSANLLLEDVDDEVVVYNTATDEAHLLNAATAEVWKRCDGTRTIDAIAAQLSVPPDVVVLALNELTAAGLLERPVIDERITRRRVLKTLGVAAVALPAILSINAAPAAAGAAPTCPTNCSNSDGNCQVTSCGVRHSCCRSNAATMGLRGQCVRTTSGTGSNQTCSN